MIFLSYAVSTQSVAIGAEETEFAKLSDDTMRAYARSDRALRDLDGFLRATGYEKTAFIGTNYFAISVGGIDAIRDLEENRGVDPETFAALYAGFAIPSVAKHLNLKKTTNLDGRLELKIEALDGRLRYKGAAVRLYSPEKLRELFMRRASFRTESERRRREIFSEYVFSRRRASGDLGSGGLDAEIDDLVLRYTELQPILIELQEKLQGDASASSIIGGATSHHYFGYSVGGLDVVSDLANRKAVDPETFAAIYARNVTADYAESFKITPGGQIQYEDTQLKMYSPSLLEACFKRRDTLSLRLGRQ